MQSAYQATLGDQTAFGLYPLLFYKESALFFGFYSGFTRGEYHIVCVDFIVALRRTKGRGRRTLRSPPSPSSGLHLIHPGNPLRRGTLAAAVDRDIGSCIPVQVVTPQFRMLFGCFVFGLGLFAFQSISMGFGRTFFIGGGMDCSFLRLRGVLLWSIVGITADRAISSNFVGCKPISPIAPGARIL